MSQGPLCPNLTKKVQKEVSQMANRNLPCVMLKRKGVNFLWRLPLLFVTLKLFFGYLFVVFFVCFWRLCDACSKQFIDNYNVSTLIYISV